MSMTQRTHSASSFDLPRASLAARVGEPRDRRRERGHLSAPSVFSTRCSAPGVVSLGVDRGRGRGGQQHPEDRRRAGWPIARARSGRSCWPATRCRRRSRPLIALAHSWTHVLASACSTASGRASAARRAMRCSRRLRRRRHARQGLRLSSRDGSRRRRRRAAARHGVPVLLSGRVSHAVRADDHSRRDRGRASVPRARKSRRRASG